MDMYNIKTAGILFDYFFTQIKVLSATTNHFYGNTNESFYIDRVALQKMFDCLINFSNNFLCNCQKDKMSLYLLKIFTDDEYNYMLDTISQLEHKETIFFVDRLICKLFQYISIHTDTDRDTEYFWTDTLFDS